jgi:hypothetical protein
MFNCVMLVCADENSFHHKVLIQKPFRHPMRGAASLETAPMDVHVSRCEERDLASRVWPRAAYRRAP